jgi:hypothetical protein
MIPNHAWWTHCMCVVMFLTDDLYWSRVNSHKAPSTWFLLDMFIVKPTVFLVDMIILWSPLFLDASGRETTDQHETHWTRKKAFVTHERVVEMPCLCRSMHPTHAKKCFRLSRQSKLKLVTIHRCPQHWIVKGCQWQARWCQPHLDPRLILAALTLSVFVTKHS